MAPGIAADAQSSSLQPSKIEEAMYRRRWLLPCSTGDADHSGLAACSLVLGDKEDMLGRSCLFLFRLGEFRTSAFCYVESSRRVKEP